MTSVSTTAATGERVDAILEAACRVVVREGAHGLRLAAVAEEAGVSKALVHYYFATRRDLLRNAFSRSEERWQAALAERLEKVPTGAQRVEQALLMGVDPKEPFAGHRALWNEVWSSLRFDDELRPLVESSYRNWLKRLTALVEEGRGDGSVDAAVRRAHRLAACASGTASTRCSTCD
jgi:AcrR family transcriptional regulator